MADPKLRKVEFTVQKDKSSGVDLARIPASGVDVVCYKRGVIADRNHTGADLLTVGAGRTLYCRDTKGLVVGDILQKTTDDTITLEVTAKPSDSTATVTVTGGTRTLSANDRLVIVGPSGRVPTMYTDPLGATSTSSLLTDSTGYAQCYLKERQADALIGMNSGSITPQFREAITSGDDEFAINVLNYADLQAAIDALPSTLGNYGGTILVPAGLYAISSTINVNKAVKIKGEGIGNTVFYWLNATKDVTAFNVTNSYVSFEDLSIVNVQNDPGTGVGIEIGHTSGITGFSMRNVLIQYSPSWAIKYTAGEGGNAYVSHSLIEKVTINFPQSGGGIYLGSDTFVTKIDSCVINMNGGDSVGYGIHAKNPTNLRITSCEIAPTTNTVAIFLETDGSGDGQGGPLGVTINDCDIETTGGSTAYAIHVIEGKNVTITGNYIYYFTNGIHFEDCWTPTTLNNNFRRITTTSIQYTDCLNPLSLNDYNSGSGTTETPAPVVIAESGTTAGTILVANGLVQVPRYATGSLPAAAAGKVLNGALAYDTTLNKLVCLVSGTWTAMH